MKKHLELFIDDIENDKFYEAHEDLEHYWHTIRKTDHPLKNLCKGFINGATAYELIKRGNDKGARTLWKTHQKYLPIMEEGIENYELFYKANEILQELKKKHYDILGENLQGITMSVKLDTRTFFFNAETDFLAYYKRHEIKIDSSKKVKDLLVEIQELEPIFKFKKTNTLLAINGVSIKATLGIDKAVELFGTSWEITPISTFRAINDLIINEDDFIAKHEVLAEFADEEDFKYYKTLISDYYASTSLSHNQDYFGDSMFLYADYLIDKYPEKKEAILKVIDCADGIWLYEKECNQYPLNDNARKINALKAEFPAQIVKKYTPETMAYYDKAEAVLCSHFGVQKDEDCALETIMDNITIEKVTAELKHSFEAFNVAFYAGSFECENLAEVQGEAEKLLTAIGAKVVKFGSSNSADGFDLVSANSEIAYNKAGNIALDAFDSGAEILVVDSKESHFMMDQSVKSCERVVGRDITIPILNISQILSLAIGITDVAKLGLDEHKIKQELVG